MGLTFKKDDSLEKMFEEFAFDPDKADKEKVEKDIHEKLTDKKTNKKDDKIK